IGPGPVVVREHHGRPMSLRDDAARTPGMAEARTSARVMSVRENEPGDGHGHAGATQCAWKAESSSLPAMNVRVKPLLRRRRIGDLNPGGWLHPTALAVRRHRPD